MKTPAFHLLVVSIDNTLPNRLIAALRQDHVPVRATGINSKSTLAKHLQQMRIDLLLLVESEAIIPAQWLELYAQSGSRTPVLIACAEKSSLEKIPEAKLANYDLIAANNTIALSRAIKKQAAYAREKINNRVMANRIRQLEKQQRFLLDSCQDALAILGKGRHLYCNDRYVGFFARHSRSSSGALKRKKLLHGFLQDLLSEADRQPLHRILSSEITTSKTLQVCSKATAENLSLTFSSIFFKHEKCIQVIVKTASGNSHYSRDKQSLANEDLLTRLINQENFTAKVEAAITKAINQQKFCTLMIVQINAFKEMQATIGRSGTNQLLYEISEFLNKSINKPFIASRMAEDEFGLLLNDSSAEQGATLANYIHHRLNSAFSGGDKPVAISASLGMTFINELALDAQDMINRARINRNLAPTYTMQQAAFHSNTSVIPQLIRKALDSGEWYLRFQPLLSFTPDNRKRYEVLLSLNVRAGEFNPEELLAQANIHNLAGEIDRQILNALIDEIDIQEDSSKLIFIPVSGNTLVNKSMLTWLSSLLQRHRGCAGQLVFQLSEIDLHGNSQLARTFCNKLNELGIGVAVSRFGSAMDPLSLVSTVKPNVVILDQSLHSEILYSKKQQQSVGKLISALHHEQVRVGISGIEEMELLPLLWELGVDLVQGSCLARAAKSMDYVFPQEEKIKPCI